RFTLIELLVVIAIVGILASMLLPALNRAKDTAKKILCAGNEKQIGFAMFSYTNDFDGFYPALYANYNWDDQISKYLGLNWSEAQQAKNGLDDSNLNTKIFLCPSDKVQIPVLNSGKSRRSYVANEYRPNVPLATTTFQKYPGLIRHPDYTICSVKISKVTKPSYTLMLGEQWRNWNMCGTGQGTGAVCGISYSKLRYEPGTAFYTELLCHGRGLANLTMVDGSTKACMGQTMLDGKGALPTDFRGSWLDHTK
ncbi:MAG: prepilin-type N-terminal cleavage/methylation domain-containing protein, partial [Verrucomicrobiota bacterium]|nr:prepilin-type N-terminal cleavage/methylation domain-containing protein [Verrucomicrobiota bacterium]